jgi:hypothetical protein
MRKKYKGNFMGYNKKYTTIILYNTHDIDNSNLGEVHIPIHRAPGICQDLMYGDMIEFYCDAIYCMGNTNKFALSAVDVRIIKTQQLK